MSLTSEEQDLLPIARAATRLGISRATLWRRVREHGLTVRTNPLNRRYRLVSWEELVSVFKPDDSIVIASSTSLPERAYLTEHGAQLEQETGLHVTVVADQPLIARVRMLKARIIDTFSGGSGIGASITLGENGYASDGLGPFPLRDCYPAIYDPVSAALVTGSESTLNTIWDISRGTRIADISSAVPDMRAFYRALLAWVQVDVNDVVFVKCQNWDSAIRAVVAGKADLAYAGPLSAAAFDVEASSAHLRWLDLDPEASDRDRAGAKRHREILPMYTFRENRHGVKSSLGVWGLWRMGHYGSRYVHADAHFDFAYGLAKWHSQQGPTVAGTGGVLEPSPIAEVAAALPEVFIPIHEGAITYFRERGLWMARDEARQECNLWVMNSYIKAWRLAVSIAEGLRVVIDPNNPRWMRLWEDCKRDLPPVVARSDEEVARCLADRTVIKC